MRRKKNERDVEKEKKWKRRSPPEMVAEIISGGGGWKLCKVITILFNFFFFWLSGETFKKMAPLISSPSFWQESEEESKKNCEPLIHRIY